MNLVELDESTVTDKVHVGDTVLIRGTVVKVQPGVGVLAELFSKTDQYEAWIALDKVAALVLADVPDEPTDGTWLVGNDDTALADGAVNVFTRSDADAPEEPERRWPRRWKVAGTGEWVDWPTAYERGANPDRRLVAPPVVPSEPERFRTMVDFYIRRAGERGITLSQIAQRLRSGPYRGSKTGVGPHEVEQVADALVVAGRATKTPYVPGGNPVMARYFTVPTAPPTVAIREELVEPLMAMLRRNTRGATAGEAVQQLQRRGFADVRQGEIAAVLDREVERGTVTVRPAGGDLVRRWRIKQ